MKKVLTVEYYEAEAEVKRARSGYDVVIRIPFQSKKTAEGCLEGLYNLKEANSETTDSRPKTD